MSKYVSVDRDTAERYRASRGFSSFRDWRDQNREAEKNFRSRMSNPSEDKSRLLTLIDNLEKEYARYIRPNL